MDPTDKSVGSAKCEGLSKVAHSRAGGTLRVFKSGRATRNPRLRGDERRLGCEIGEIRTTGDPSRGWDPGRGGGRLKKKGFGPWTPACAGVGGNDEERRDERSTVPAQPIS